jgi:hypothetical protein
MITRDCLEREDNIKIAIKVISWDVVDWTDIAWDRDK